MRSSARQIDVARQRKVRGHDVALACGRGVSKGKCSHRLGPTLWGMLKRFEGASCSQGVAHHKWLVLVGVLSKCVLLGPFV